MMAGKARRFSVAMALSLTIALTSSCSTNGVADLPLPAPGVGSGGYTITAIFANALNVPAEAKVKLAGADIGQMESMVARNYTAVTTLRIMDGVRLPQGSTAELRSATPLGDVFISVRPPADTGPNAPLLKDGDTIGLESTTAAATVESVLSSAAILVNGGAVRNFTSIVNGLGRATGNQGEAFGSLIEKTNTLLDRMNARTDEISTAMDQTSKLAEVINDKNDTLAEVLDNAAPATDVLAENATAVADLVNAVGATTTELAKFPSIAGTDTSGRSVIKDANSVANSFNDVVLTPDATLFALNRLMPHLIKATPSGAVSIRTSIDRLVWGSRPDIGYPGDLGLHGPKWNNFQQIVGSFKYVLWRLQERIVGKGPGVPQVPVIPSPTEPGQVDVATPVAPPPIPEYPHLPESPPIPGTDPGPQPAAPGTVPPRVGPAPQPGQPQ
jgi:virulence factor Mce-like protein